MDVSHIRITRYMDCNDKINDMKNIYLYLNTRDELLRIDISKIVYFEADGNYTNILLSNQLKGVVCMNLSRMQQILSERLKEHASVFARVGKKHIINHTYVYQVNVLKQKLILSDGNHFTYQLDISKDALKKLKDTYVASLSCMDINSKTTNH